MNSLNFHTRNHGCRIRQYTQDGVDMLSLENNLVKVAVALSKGGDIVELLYKPEDIDFLWHSFNGLSGVGRLPVSATENGPFLDVYSGGWQELFPTYGASTVYHSAPMGIHGEACIFPWSCTVLEDTVDCVEVELSLRMVRSPFLMKKRLKLLWNDLSLYINLEVKNCAGTKMDFMWGQHPAFGIPFLDESVRLHLKGEPTLIYPESSVNEHAPFAGGARGKWPCLPDKNGQPFDLSRAYAPEDKLYMEYAITDLEDGEYELVNHNKGLGVRMRWDKMVFPHLWVWGLYCGVQEYPWYGRTYVMAVEPWSTLYADYQSAREHNDVFWLEAGQAKETQMVVTVVKKT